MTRTEQNAKLDADIQEGKAAVRRAEQEQQQLQQVNENLSRTNSWLEENMNHLSAALTAERQKSGARVELASNLPNLTMACSKSSQLVKQHLGVAIVGESSWDYCQFF